MSEHGHPRITRIWENDEKGELGLVAAVIRQAIEVASGVGEWRMGQTINMNNEAVRFLFGRDFDRWVELAGADPDSVRAGILQRCPWLRQEPVNNGARH